MSNLYGYFVNERTISYISSEYADANNIDISNPETSNKIQLGIKKALEGTYSILDKSKVQKNNINDAIEKVVNVTMKRLNLQPRQRNMPVAASMRMPVQHSTNTRMDDSLQSRTDNYLKEYREFNVSNKPNDVPDWLKSQNTNPKRIAEEQQKKMQPNEMFNKTSTRKNNQVFNDSDANPSQEIEDYGGNMNFSYFNETPEITSAFDDAFYNTGIDPSSINDDFVESLDSRLKKIESDRSSIKTPEQKIENIEELFKNDDAFKKHLNMSNKMYHRTNDLEEEQNINKMMNQTNKNQQLMAQQNRMHPSVMNNAEQYSNKNMQEQFQQQFQQQEQQLIMKFTTKEKQYQEHINGMQQKMTKYEEYLKTLMQKYNELKEDRDLIKNSSMERFRNTDSSTLNAIEEKKAELIRISQGIQEKINRLEQLQQNSNENNQNDD
jgi:hypothetical protein